MITVNTKPLLTALNQAIVNSNVSRYYKKSGIAQITIQPDGIRMNFEAANITSEVFIRGASTVPEVQTIMVDNMLLKQLVATITAATVNFEIDANALVIIAGKSRFTLPRIDSDGLYLNTPATVEGLTAAPLDKSGWKFIKDNQMYAVAMSFTFPVYTRVWVSDAHDAIVGDMMQSVFTHSSKSSLDRTWLLSDTIINLLNSMPDNAQLYAADDSYIIVANADSFAYRAQFKPESETDVGSYHAEIFLNMMNHPERYFAVAAAQLTQILNQSLLLTTDTDATIKFDVHSNQLTLTDANLTSDIDVDFDGDFSLEFKTESLRSVISNYGDVDIRIGPSILDDTIVGIIVWDDDLTTVLAGVK